MPSGHGGGGSGGSHGGSCGSGGYSGGFGGGRTGSGSLNNHLGPKYIHLGKKTLIVSERSQFSILSLFIFLVFSLAIAFASLNSVKQAENNLKAIESNNVYYLNMIEKAESDPLYKVVGIVTKVKYNEDFEKWYIEYVFTNDVGTIEGYSYCVYSEKLDAPAFNEVIDIAIDSYNSIEADSMPMDYKNFTIQDDGKYLYAQDQLSVLIFLKDASFIVFGAIIVSMICIIIFSKRVKTEEIATEKATPKINKRTTSFEPAKKYCAHCGSEINVGEGKCPCCGSRKVYRQKDFKDKEL